MISEPASRRDPAALWYVAGIALGALLLFQVEPAIAKRLLPAFGGSAAVWNTCLLFFQTLLLCGYLYSHLLTGMEPRLQRRVHAAALVLPLLALPAARLESGASPGRWPLASLLATLMVTVGPAFFVLSTNSSLLQHWYARRFGKEPYFLYGISNAASLAALIAYPLLVEPSIGLGLQWRALGCGYLVFMALALWCMRLAPGSGEDVSVAPISPPPSRAQRAGWLFRSSVASLLLPAISLRIATDVSAMPLLWVTPLALYLLSYTLAFLPSAPYPRRALEILAVCGIVIGLGATPTASNHTLWLQLAAPLATLFVGCWICHGDLARDRPPPDRLTGYYAWIAVGGFAGALAGNLIAPLCFQSIAEHPLALFLLSMVLGMGTDGGASLMRSVRHKGTWIGWASMTALMGLWAFRTHGDPTAMSPLWNLIPIALLVAVMPLFRVPGQLPFAAALVALATVAGLYTSGRVLSARRGFFGVLRIMEARGVRTMMHGTTVHGAWRIDPPQSLPTAYYHVRSPISRVVAAQKDTAHIAVIGLGTGSIAAYGRAGQELRFYEIDPLVEPMARAWFPFLDGTKAHATVVLGDARLKIAEAPAHGFDLIVLDAFSSDAIPVHLMTDEAFASYLDKLAPEGVLLAHISNRYFELEPLLRAVAARFGLHGAVARYTPSPASRAEAAVRDHVVALSRSAAVAAALGPDFVPLGDGAESEWTDDRSSVLGLLRRERE